MFKIGKKNLFVVYGLIKKPFYRAIKSIDSQKTEWIAMYKCMKSKTVSQNLKLLEILTRNLIVSFMIFTSKLRPVH